jgi:hypothetical protein
MNISSQIGHYWAPDDYYKFERIDVPWALGYYEFTSIGSHGHILKGVVFQNSEETPHLLDLVYGDVVEDIKVNTSAVTNNGDLDKLLLTIAAITITFLSEHSTHQVKLNGISGPRTRLYRKFINKHIDALVRMVNIYAENADENSTEIIEKSYNKDFAHLLVSDHANKIHLK